MKNLTYFILSILISLILCIPLTVNAMSHQAGDLQVAKGTVCLDVVNLDCVEARASFPSNVGKLHCLTRINGAQDVSQVTHVWYFGHTERARVTLDVRSANWRTYSSKIIQSHEIGDWHIDVLGPEGQFLEIVQFEIVP
jgi:hypothetical protein